MQVLYQVEIPFPVSHLKKENTGNGISTWYCTPSIIMQNCQSLIYIQSLALYHLLPLELDIMITNIKPFFPHFSNVQKEMELRLSSIPPVKSQKMASLSFTSRVRNCVVYFLLKSVLILSIFKTISFNNPISYVEQEM